MRDIKVTNLSVNYGDKVVFDSFDATFEKGKINVILGGSGVGKSTLLGAVAGIVNHGGQVDGIDEGISFIFQKDRLIPTISVFKNLDLILKSVEKDKNVRKKLIEDMLSVLEISECRDKRPIEISGGQAQRVALARAFLYPAKLLLMDEPFKALDTAIKERLIGWLLTLNEISPRTILFVTHAIDECLLTADKYMVISGSPAKIVLEGKIEKSARERTLADEDLSTVRQDILKTLMV